MNVNFYGVDLEAFSASIYASYFLNFNVSSPLAYDRLPRLMGNVKSYTRGRGDA